MAKIVLNDVTSGYNLTKIRDNFDKIANAFNNGVYWKDNPVGEPNSLVTNMDANGKRIINLPDPVANGEPATKGWLLLLGDNAASSAAAAALSAASALASANAASASAAIIADWGYRGTWLTATAYKKNNIVVGTGTYAGSSLIALSDHTSTGATTDTDFGTGKWGYLAQKGNPGAGTGDMLSANNLSDVANAATSRTNLGATAIGSQIFTSTNAASVRSALSLGTAALQNVGVAANNVVQLNGSSQLPAVDGSLLTNVVVTNVPQEVSQTVLNGPVDSNGLSAFGGSTGTTTVTASGTLRATAFAGLSDYTGNITNPSWTGLSNNGSMYLYFDITSVGAITTGSVILQPIYIQGGTYSTTNGQCTINISERTVKVGNGSVANTVNRVFVGEVTVAGGVVTAILWYALRGKYVSPEFGIALATQYTNSHNLGVTPRYYSTVLVNKTTELGFAVGEEAPGFGVFTSNNDSVGYVTGISRNSVRVVTGAVKITLLNASGGASLITLANWKLKIYCDRGW